MSIQEHEQGVWLKSNRLAEQKYLPKAVRVLVIVLLAISAFYWLPGNWAALSLVVTPILLFIVLCGHYFRNVIWSDPDSHLPLILLGVIYGWIGWYMVSQPAHF